MMDRRTVLYLLPATVLAPQAATAQNHTVSDWVILLRQHFELQTDPNYALRVAQGILLSYSPGIDLPQDGFWNAQTDVAFQEVVETYFAINGGPTGESTSWDVAETILGWMLSVARANMLGGEFPD